MVGLIIRMGLRATARAQVNVSTAQRLKSVLPKTFAGLSAAAGGFDGGDVDLLHGHHGVEGALGLSATGGKRIHEGARVICQERPQRSLAPTATGFPLRHCQ